jgi:WD40 repeat protein
MMVLPKAGHQESTVSTTEQVAPTSSRRRRGRVRWLIIAAAAVAVAAGIAVPLTLRSGPSNTLAATLIYRGSMSVGAVAFSPNGKVLATSGEFENIYLWDVATGRRIATLMLPADPAWNTPGAWSLAFSPGGNLLAAGNYDISKSSVWLFDVNTGRLVATLTAPIAADYNSVAFSPDGQMLAAVDQTNRVYLWDVNTGGLAATLSTPFAAGFTSVAFSPDGQTLAAAAQHDSTVYLWDLGTRSLIAALKSPGHNGLSSVTFSPDGKTVAAGDMVNRVYLWDVATHQLAATLTDPEGVAEPFWQIPGNVAIAFSPDGKTLAAAPSDCETGSVSLFDTDTDQLQTTLFQPDNNVGCADVVAFSPRGNVLAVGDGPYAYLYHIG